MKWFQKEYPGQYSHCVVELNEEERANPIASTMRRYLSVRASWNAAAGNRRDTLKVAPPLGLVLPRPAHLVLYVPGLHLLVVLESLPSPPLLVFLTFRRLIALAANSGFRRVLVDQ